MSFPEILEVVRALPRTEKVRLMHALVDDVGSLQQISDEEAVLATLFPPGAVLHPGWQVTTDEAGMRVLQEALAATKERG
jgi:hypothetical protein